MTTTSIITIGFGYSTVNAEACAIARRAAEKIRRHQQRAAAEIIGQEGARPRLFRHVVAI